jgi:ABC-type glutathione transport system ATPase component
VTQDDTASPGGGALLEVRHLVQEFVLRDYGGAKGGGLQAVSDVSFELHAGETLGIVGETGSGKSTLARSVIQAPPPKRGSVIFEGDDLTALPRGSMKAVRQHLQMVFQDPFTSLDPKWTVSRIVAEPLVAYAIGSRGERRERVDSLLDLAGLDPVRYGGRRPRELSGGQAQRIAIARALVLEPKWSCP